MRGQDRPRLTLPRYDAGSGINKFGADSADLPRINESAVHIDFMIGSDDVTVTGRTKDGHDVVVMRGGAWQI